MIFRRRHDRAASSSVAEADSPHDQEAASLLEEIKRLREANGQRPNAARDLVRLRHKAGVSLVRAGSPDAEFPAPSGALPAAGEGGLPELRPEDLTPELLRAAILRDGCALVRGVVDRDRAARLGADAAELFASRQEGNAAEVALQYEEFEPEEGYSLAERAIVTGAGCIWLVDSPTLLSEVFELYEAAGLRELITGYLGGRPVMSVNKSTLRSASAEVSAVDWHQDGAFMGDVRALNVWMSLSDCGERAPGLTMLPRRLDHILTTGTPGAKFDWSVSPTVVEEAAGEAGTIRPVFEPGDVVFFDDMFLHAPWVTPDMPETRYAIESWFFSPSTLPGEYTPLAF